MDDKVCQIYAIAKGKVQRVGYRAFCVKQATELGLSGYAQNLPNGNVKILAEGQQSILRQYVTLLRKGPILAKVNDVEFRWEEAEKVYFGFEIKI
ncbi:MAG: acylphosphatase [Chloroflexi bacterium]|nr:MAG: acylphosphatase [Chloroflexota bacterium]